MRDLSQLDPTFHVDMESHQTNLFSVSQNGPNLVIKLEGMDKLEASIAVLTSQLACVQENMEEVVRRVDRMETSLATTWRFGQEEIRQFIADLRTATAEDVKRLDEDVKILLLDLGTEISSVTDVLVDVRSHIQTNLNMDEPQMENGITGLNKNCSNLTTDLEPPPVFCVSKKNTPNPTLTKNTQQSSAVCDNRTSGMAEVPTAAQGGVRDLRSDDSVVNSVQESRRATSRHNPTSCQRENTGACVVTGAGLTKHISRDLMKKPPPTRGRYLVDFYVRNFRGLINSGIRVEGSLFILTEAKLCVRACARFTSAGQMAVSLNYVGQPSGSVVWPNPGVRQLKMRATICDRSKTLPDLAIGQSEVSGQSLTALHGCGQWSLASPQCLDLLQLGYGFKEGYCEGAVLIRFDLSVS